MMWWEYLLKYFQVFLVGGVICILGQILINKTKMTSARILVLSLLIGVLLEAVGLFKYIEQFGHAGITVQIVGFGSTLAKSAIEGAKEGFLGAVTGGMRGAAGGLTAAIVFGFIFSLVFKSHSKKL